MSKGTSRVFSIDNLNKVIVDFFRTKLVNESRNFKRYRRTFKLKKEYKGTRARKSLIFLSPFQFHVTSYLMRGSCKCSICTLDPSSICTLDPSSIRTLDPSRFSPAGPGICFTSAFSTDSGSGQRVNSQRGAAPVQPSSSHARSSLPSSSE